MKLKLDNTARLWPGGWGWCFLDASSQDTLLEVSPNGNQWFKALDPTGDAPLLTRDRMTKFWIPDNCWLRLAGGSGNFHRGMTHRK